MIQLLWPQVTMEAIDRSWRALDDASHHPREANWAFLQELLRTRADTVIGRRLGLGEITTVEEFRARVPITPYDQLIPYIDRIKQGEPDVLFPGRAYHFTRTTGTTGSPKDIPLGSGYADDVVRAIGPFWSVLEKHYPGCIAGGLSFSGSFIEERTSAGIGIGQPTGAARCVFGNLGFMDWAPEAVFESTDFELRYYAQLYYALIKDVRLIICLSPAMLILFFRKMEEFGEVLAADVEDGTFSRGPGNIAAMRPGLGELPPPNPAAAARLRASLKEHGRFIPPAVWPNLRALVAWRGASYQHQLDAIAEVCPGVDMWPGHVGSSEAALFVPIDQTWGGGVPCVHSTFYEFYPDETEPVPGNFVDIDKLEDGAAYRVLLTTERGMFRYPITDVYRVVGRHRELPILAVSHRAGGGINLTSEKLVDKDVVTAMGYANALTAALTEYQLVPVRGKELSGFVLLLEYRDAPPATTELQRILQQFEESLKKNTFLYARYTSQMLPLQLAVVPRGTFEAARRKKHDGKRNDFQYKQSRLANEFMDVWTLEPVVVVGADGEVARPR